MTDTGFYHLTRFDLDEALPRLLARAYQGGHRCLVRFSRRDVLDRLNERLWSFDPDAFLPHGGPGDGHRDRQPIYLSTDGDNPNRADILVLVDGAAPGPDADGFSRCLILFDGKDAEAVAAARGWWTDLKARGHQLTYWQQTDRGGWQKKAG